jgi:DNA-binding FadR family transcriptional regulator
MNVPRRYDADVLGWMANAPPDHENLMALLELRTIIELQPPASPRQVLDIERVYRAMAASLPMTSRHAASTTWSCTRASSLRPGNVFLSRFAAIIRMVLLASFRVSANTRESYSNSLAEQWAVADAIRRRAPADAERAMRLLLKGTARLRPSLPSNLRERLCELRRRSGHSGKTARRSMVPSSRR